MEEEELLVLEKNGGCLREGRESMKKEKKKKKKKRERERGGGVVTPTHIHHSGWSHAIDLPSLTFCDLSWRLPLGSASTLSTVCCRGRRSRRSFGETPPGCSPPSTSTSSDRNDVIIIID